MDLVNIIYRYVNRFINSEELIKNLEAIENKNVSKEEYQEIKKLIEQIKLIIKTVPIEIDQVEKNRMALINRLLKSFDTVNLSNKTNDKTQKEIETFIKERKAALQKDKKRVRDSSPRYNEIFNLLVSHPLYIKYCQNRSDLELLEFITQYISVPLPPKIEQKEFDELVKVGIKEDKKESLWRLAMNYNRKGKDFSKIEDYFIEKRDHYYLAELISGVNEDLDLNRLTKKRLNTKDLDFIRKLANTEYLQDIFSNKQKEQVKDFLKEKEAK